MFNFDETWPTVSEDVPFSELIPHERDADGNFVFKPQLPGAPTIVASVDEVKEFIRGLGDLS